MQVGHHSSKITGENIELRRLEALPHAVLFTSSGNGLVVLGRVEVRDVALRGTDSQVIKFKFNFNTESRTVFNTLLMSSSMASKTICVSENRNTAGWALMPAYSNISLRDSRHSDRPVWERQRHESRAAWALW